MAEACGERLVELAALPELTDRLLHVLLLDPGIPPELLLVVPELLQPLLPRDLLCPVIVVPLARNRPLLAVHRLPNNLGLELVLVLMRPRHREALPFGQRHLLQVPLAGLYPSLPLHHETCAQQRAP